MKLHVNPVKLHSCVFTQRDALPQDYNTAVSDYRSPSALVCMSMMLTNTTISRCCMPEELRTRWAVTVL